MKIDARLHDELLGMDAHDQQVRAELAADGSLFKGYHPRMEAVHREHAVRLREIIAASGWPGASLVGADAAAAAWRLAQHSIGEPRFMRDCRALVEAAVAKGDAPAWQFAMLDDRIRVYEGIRQRFGSQLRGGKDGLEPYPIEDEERVEERRREAGLPPLAEVLARARAHPPPRAPDQAARDAQELAWRRRVGWIR